MRFIGSEIYRGSSYGPTHPLRVPRVPTVIDLSRALGWLPPERYLRSPRAKPAALTRWHTPAYVAALQKAEADGAVSEEVRVRHHLGTPSNPVYPEVFRRPATAAGGTVLGASLILRGHIVYNPGGGTHHGLPDQANGFCYLNDPVLGLLALRDGGAQRLAYVDIDAHHCDGVDYAFRDDPDVLLISTHEARRWPFTGGLEDRGAGNVWNVPLPRGAGDADMAAVLVGLILPRIEAHRPDAIILQAGADAVAEDPLSRLALTNGALWSVVAAIRDLGRPLMVLGGGGYNPWSVGRCWTGIWGMLAGHDIPDRLPPEAEAILRGLSFPGHRLGKAPPEHWFTTLADAPRGSSVSPVVRDSLSTLTDRARIWA
ncbi:acetoin utilization protein AcuC [Palleronia caenipelagi]|uniref:Acetoin utilization protein AcuC n=1 Tax=Palleronia caenipelagi TaxID=2489174 RepID=A0A547QAD6_9RHOB|nr:acetoin utilization protein AcuC [Palleronia caenipelagi]TRD23322.1 acetoin utilization protein AcuC [Palleronia caenipelagi]